jgi:threonine dehydratase
MDSLLRLILNSRVYDVVTATPLDAARRLSRQTGHHVFLKREDLQPIFTYKLRGAYNRIAHLSAEERARGVISAADHSRDQG